MEGRKSEGKMVEMVVVKVNRTMKIHRLKIVLCSGRYLRRTRNASEMLPRFCSRACVSRAVLCFPMR